jgi:hypothetical protein
MFLLATFVAAQIVAPETACTATNNSPLCHVFKTQCQTQDCSNLGYYLCREAGTCPVCDTCANPFLDAVPSIRNATELAFSICTEMPEMENCNQCPPPTNGISNCNVLKAYIDLCDEMPRMSQCRGPYRQYCEIVGCQGVKAIGSSTTSNGSKPSATTTVKSSASKSFGSLIGFILMLF